MCTNIEAISKTSQGELNYCKGCKQFHFEFNNIYFEFTPEQFEQFKAYILFVEADYWEYKYACANVKRKIPIPTLQDNLVLMFDRQEIKELKVLVSDKNKAVFDTLLNVDDIDYTYIVN